jgi:NADH-quinone oxidoreductase subunit M
MNAIGGLAKKMPVWSCFMVFFVLASVGLPGLNGFVSEFMCLLGTFVATDTAAQWPGVLGPEYAAIAAIGMVLAAMYLLIMVGKVVFGKLKEPEHDGAHSLLPADLNPREIGILVPMAALCIWIGVQPTVLTDAMRGSVEDVLSPYPRIVQEEHGAPQTPIIIEKKEQNG